MKWCPKEKQAHLRWYTLTWYRKSVAKLKNIQLPLHISPYIRFHVWKSIFLFIHIWFLQSCAKIFRQSHSKLFFSFQSTVYFRTLRTLQRLEKLAFPIFSPILMMMQVVCKAFINFEIVTQIIVFNICRRQIRNFRLIKKWHWTASKWMIFLHHI